MHPDYYSMVLSLLQRYLSKITTKVGGVGCHYFAIRRQLIQSYFAAEWWTTEQVWIRLPDQLGRPGGDCAAVGRGLIAGVAGDGGGDGGEFVGVGVAAVDCGVTSGSISAARVAAAAVVVGCRLVAAG